MNPPSAALQCAHWKVVARRGPSQHWCPAPRICETLYAVEVARCVDFCMSSTEPLTEITFTSRPERLKGVRGQVRALLVDRGHDAAFVNGCVLAVDEACSNIIRHGYGPNTTGDIVLEIWANADEVIFRLHDSAAPMNPQSLHPRLTGASLETSGRGMYFIQQVMDEVTLIESHRPTGNTLELRKKVA